jgi:hypothetical protein
MPIRERLSQYLNSHLVWSTFIARLRDDIRVHYQAMPPPRSHRDPGMAHFHYHPETNALVETNPQRNSSSSAPSLKDPAEPHREERSSYPRPFPSQPTRTRPRPTTPPQQSSSSTQRRSNQPSPEGYRTRKTMAQQQQQKRADHNSNRTSTEGYPAAPSKRQPASNNLKRSSTSADQTHHSSPTSSPPRKSVNRPTINYNSRTDGHHP